jgi:hypothetical protein|nr:MAG TPA: hypothetical protein [Caudoviricetes sp.]
MNLIYDRTEADVTEAVRIERKLHKGEALSAAETAAWNAGMKGGYNTSDMNRVESAVKTLAAELNSAGYPVEITETADWLPGDTVTREQWEIYLENVRRLRAAYYTLAETGELPKPGDKLGYVGANNIEKVLADIDLLLDGMKSVYRRAGTFTAGGSYTRQMIRSV